MRRSSGTGMAMYQPARLVQCLPGMVLLGAMLLSVAGCNDPEPEPKPEPAPAPVQVSTPVTPQALAAAQSFRDQSTQLLEALNRCTEQLLSLGNQFLEQTQADTLAALQTQWQTCYDLYQTSTVLQGYGEAQQSNLAEARSHLGNPLSMPGFIDSVQGYPFSGIVNDASLPLDAETLRQQHGVTDDSEVSIGFHVVAFLLWGEHHLQPELPTRPLTDYEIATSWEDEVTDLPIEAHPNNRRRQLLKLTLELLAADSQALLGSWLNGSLPDSMEGFEKWRGRQIQALQQQPDNQVLQSLSSTLEAGTTEAGATGPG